MATALVRQISIADAKVWKGGSRLVMGPLTASPAFPSYLEDVIDLATMGLKNPYVDFGATTNDGFAIGRTWEDVEGVETDQRDYALLAGGQTGVTMTGSFTSLYTDIETMVWLWGLGTVQAIAADAPSQRRAQKKAGIGSGVTTSPRQFFILQQHMRSAKVRMFGFRAARVSEPGDLNIQRTDPSQNDVTLAFDADSAIVTGDDFGSVWEET